MMSSDRDGDNWMVLLRFLALWLLIRSLLPRLQIFLAPSDADIPGSLGSWCDRHLSDPPSQTGRGRGDGIGAPSQTDDSACLDGSWATCVPSILLVDREPKESKANDGALIRGVEVRVRWIQQSTLSKAF